MKSQVITLFVLILVLNCAAVIRIVDINGSGQFTTIQAGINAANAGDTVKVLPGFYQEAVSLNKSIVLQGSGYENTMITSSNNPTITQTGGKIKWFTISCTGGTGINITSGVITNCVIKSCTGNGVSLLSDNHLVVSNCIMLNNSSWGITTAGNTLNNDVVFNCISRNNTQGGFDGTCPQSSYPYVTSSLWTNYNCGSHTRTLGNQGIIDVDPLLISTTDFHLAGASPCVNTGHPGLLDPDGSRSDMGYFGGPEAPVFPVVTDMKIIPLQGGGVQVQATGKANY